MSAETIELGDRVRDKITGFTGVVDCMTTWLNGCTRAGVVSTELKDGLPMERQFIDVEQLDFIAQTNLVVVQVEDGPGGDRRDPVSERPDPR